MAFLSPPPLISNYLFSFSFSGLPSIIQLLNFDTLRDCNLASHQIFCLYSLIDWNVSHHYSVYSYSGPRPTSRPCIKCFINLIWKCHRYYLCLIRAKSIPCISSLGKWVSKLPAVHRWVLCVWLISDLFPLVIPCLVFMSCLVSLSSISQTRRRFFELQNLLFPDLSLAPWPLIPVCSLYCSWLLLRLHSLLCIWPVL
jgi:hypothetical protein